MFDTIDASTDAVTPLRAAVDQLLDADLSRWSRDELLAVTAGFEVQRRRQAAVEHRLIAELHTRGVASEMGCVSTGTLLARLLRISPTEAGARVKAADNLGPRRGLDGEALPALFPAVAAAVLSGSISERHAGVIRRTVDRLPHAVGDQADEVEQALTEHARTLDPKQLGQVARRLVDCLDPDGTLADERDHARRRQLTLVQRRDGSGRLDADLTPEAFVVCQAALDPLARPVPCEEDGVADRRTPGQRMHDALLDGLHRLLRAGDLPDSGGTGATLLMTIPIDTFESRTGLVTTEHGGTLSVPEALRIAAEAELIPVLLGYSGGVLAFGQSRRVASAAQRRALTARDGGCSFPACDRPASWCQAHHVLPWIDGGRTDLSNLTLVCGHHHREFQRQGWTCRITDGIPEWIPPDWLDREQRPRRNIYHHLLRGPRTRRGDQSARGGNVRLWTVVETANVVEHATTWRSRCPPSPPIP